MALWCSWLARIPFTDKTTGFESPRGYYIREQATEYNQSKLMVESGIYTIGVDRNLLMSSSGERF